MMEIRALIVEDSRLARKELLELIRAYPEISVLGEAENADSAFEMIGELQPDLLFLDINMPEKDGFELLEMLDEVPIVIFTTAYDEYAIKSFEYNALDYLLKPINPDRFGAALEKVKQLLQAPKEKAKTEKSLTESSQIFIKDGEQCWLVRIGQIRLFEIVGNYTRVWFDDQKPLLYKSLNQVEEKLPESVFFRVNRQQIVNVNYIEEVIPWFNGTLKLRLKDQTEVAVSRRQSSAFRDRLSL
ncbi:LytR/AlgR family response regulator transcription factor [Robiginitalea sp. IMCC43444]|uniref:LytR/AlgR family response regulator transcription factor n=1 Tax=Robiginitalea sp. IMCC43444 TaxID=3459121 RepID=UPI00404104A5